MSGSMSRLKVGSKLGQRRRRWINIGPILPNIGSTWKKLYINSDSMVGQSQRRWATIDTELYNVWYELGKIL